MPDPDGEKMSRSNRYAWLQAGIDVDNPEGYRELIVIYQGLVKYHRKSEEFKTWRAKAVIFTISAIVGPLVTIAISWAVTHI